MRARGPGIDVFLALCLAAAIALVYARALGGPFVFDDTTAIVENESIHHLSALGDVLGQPPDLTTSGRPITALSLALNYAAGGVDPSGYRATNALIHWVAALLLFGVVRRTLRSPRLGPRFGAHADGLAFATALLFAVHPLASEVVCYVSARTESLMAVFYLGTLYCAIRARDSATPWGWVAAAIALCALGMGSKEAMASAPLVVAAHDQVFWGSAEGERRRVRRATWAGLALTWCILAFLVAQAPRPQTAGFDVFIPPLTYLANQCRVLPHYLRLVLVPFPLLFDYGSPERVFFEDVWPGLVLLAGLFALSALALWRWPAVGFVGLACFAILAPSSSVVPISSEVGAERRMYLPLALLLALGVTAAWRLLERRGAQATARGVTAALALLLALLSLARAGDYRTEIGLWQHDLRIEPKSRRAHYNLARAFEREGRADEARAEKVASASIEIDYYESVLPLQPNRVESLVDLGAMNEVAGRPERAEQMYLAALGQAPDDPYALRRMALLLAHRPDADDATLDRARELAEHAVSASGRRDAAVLESLGEVQFLAGDRAGALATFREGLRTDPTQQRRRVLERLAEKVRALQALEPAK